MMARRWESARRLVALGDERAPHKGVGFFFVDVDFHGVFHIVLACHGIHAEGAGRREVEAVGRGVVLELVFVFLLQWFHEEVSAVLGCCRADNARRIYAHGQRVNIVDEVLSLVDGKLVAAHIERGVGLCGVPRSRWWWSVA